MICHEGNLDCAVPFVQQLQAEPLRAIKHLLNARRPIFADHGRGTAEIDDRNPVGAVVHRGPRALQLRRVPRSGIEEGKPVFVK